MIGFTETLFSVDVLKKAGGFNNKFAIGDIYIRKKLSLTCKVLFVPLGFGYWRSTPGQASSKLDLNNRGVIEGIKIDMMILKDTFNPLPENSLIELEAYLKSSFIRRLIKLLLLKGQFIIFFKVLRTLDISICDWKLIFKRKYPFKVFVEDMSNPMINTFNLSKESHFSEFLQIKNLK